AGIKEGTKKVPSAFLGCGLCLPGSLSLMGPSSVTGTLGGSLCVQCRYEEVYQRYNKYWCRGQYDTTCEKIVETKGEEKEERSGRVSIRDHTDHLTFIVTMENLTADDAGSYWCRIQTVWFLDVWSRDPSFHVNVFVSTARVSSSCPAAGTSTVCFNSVSTGLLLV
uniref:Ig-like domain-containing protein n=1 Tax=Neovison vison TaxID=452646 RepID=A0A8C7EP34_NEOVI